MSLKLIQKAYVRLLAHHRNGEPSTEPWPRVYASLDVSFLFLFVVIDSEVVAARLFEFESIFLEFGGILLAAATSVPCFAVTFAAFGQKQRSAEIGEEFAETEYSEQHLRRFHRSFNVAVFGFGLAIMLAIAVVGK